MHLRSTAFGNGEEIPKKYTHDGQDVSPPLEWDDVPSATKSLALIVEDPDADGQGQPEVMRVHWLIADLPPESAGLPEDVKVLPGGVIGANDWDHASWDGPAPQHRRHRYVFKLYALDRKLGLDRPTRYDLDRALANAVVFAEAKLVGTYQKATA